MKYSLLLFFTCIHLYFFSQWSSVNAIGGGHKCISVIGQDTVVFGQDSGGKIYRSTTGGSFANSYQTLLNYEWFTDMDFPTSEVGYICGGAYFGFYNNFIMKTYDNGLTWDTILTNFNNEYVISKVDFIDENTGFAIINNHSIIKTTDGGESFNYVSDPQNSYSWISDICTSPSGKLYASSRHSDLIDPVDNIYFYTNSIYSSTDFGLSWNQEYSENFEAPTQGGYAINDLYFVDDLHGYAVGGNGLFLKTIDGGVSWEEYFIQPYSELSTVFFTSPLVGYINLVGGIAKTNDGGASWSQQNIISPSIITKIVFANDTVGYALSDERIYRTNNGGGTLSINENIEQNTSVVVFPNPISSSFIVSSELIKPESIIELIDDSGKFIKQFSTSSSMDVSEISPGAYFLKIYSSQGILMKKIVICR